MTDPVDIASESKVEESDPFVSYYEAQSESKATQDHFLRLRDLLSAVLSKVRGASFGVSVADIGCGAGTFSRMWAASGCSVSGIDVNERLIQIARARASAEGLRIDFRVGSADHLPWSDGSFDVVVMPELLEHIDDWRGCLSEASRILRGGGLLYVSTTNRLCPVQQEFELPMYSWYPGWIKRRCLVRATTTHMHWVNFARYPAVNWFDPYSLGAEFRRLGMEPLDRFDLLAAHSTDRAKRVIGRVTQKVGLLRFLGHVLSSGTALVGMKSAIRSA
jgi:2-polyprenyl-6-hydroxyphenyl methylase/3-demethylubiquinone-9 3-methyltransferase